MEDNTPDSKSDLNLIVSHLESILLILKKQKELEYTEPVEVISVTEPVEVISVTEPVEVISVTEPSEEINIPVVNVSEEINISKEVIEEKEVIEVIEIKEIVKIKKKSWFKWKLWRLAFAPNYPTSSVCEGNNRWYRIFPGFFWRYDKTGSGTKN